MEPLLDILFLFNSVKMDLYPAGAERCTLINVINKCCTLSILTSVWIFGIAETGVARGSPPGTTTEVQRVGFLPAEIRFVSVGTTAMLDRRTSPRNGR
jgi:hypothetical protein